MSEGSDETAAGRDAPDIVENTAPGTSGPESAVHATAPAEASPGGETTKRPKFPPVRSLVDLYTAKGANASKFLRELDKGTSWKLDDGDVDAALNILPERDPHLARTRQLLHESIEAYDGRFARTAGDFTLRAIAADIDALEAWPPAEETDPLLSLSQLAARVSPDLRHPKQQRRAHNVLMIGVDLLSVRRGVAFELAAPILREAIGKPPEYSERKSNPRRHRVASLTLPRNDLERVRDLLDLLHPWEQELAEARARERKATAEERRAVEAAADAQSRAAELAAELASVRADLEAARQAVAVSRDQAQDVRIVASADASELRSRTIAFLNTRLRDLVATAKEASEAEPPRTPTALRLLDQAITEMRKEVEWLRSSA